MSIEPSRRPASASKLEAATLSANHPTPTVSSCSTRLDDLQRRPIAERQPDGPQAVCDRKGLCDPAQGQRPEVDRNADSGERHERVGRAKIEDDPQTRRLGHEGAHEEAVGEGGGAEHHGERRHQDPRTQWEGQPAAEPEHQEDDPGGDDAVQYPDGRAARDRGEQARGGDDQQGIGPIEAIPGGGGDGPAGRSRPCQRGVADEQIRRRLPTAQHPSQQHPEPCVAEDPEEPPAEPALPGEEGHGVSPAEPTRTATRAASSGAEASPGPGPRQGCRAVPPW